MDMLFPLLRLMPLIGIGHALMAMTILNMRMPDCRRANPVLAGAVSLAFAERLQRLAIYIVLGFIVLTLLRAGPSVMEATTWSHRLALIDDPVVLTALRHLGLLVAFGFAVRLARRHVYGGLFIPRGHLLWIVGFHAAILASSLAVVHFGGIADLKAFAIQMSGALQ